MKNSIYIIIIASIIFGQQLKSHNKIFWQEYFVIDDKIYTVSNKSDKNSNEEVDKNSNEEVDKNSNEEVDKNSNEEKIGTELSIDDFREKIKPNFLLTLIYGDIVHKTTFRPQKNYNINVIHEILGSSATTFLQSANIIKEVAIDSQKTKHRFTHQVTAYGRDYSKPFYLTAATFHFICIGTLLRG